MGFWNQDQKGHSFAEDSDMVWGDGPADAVDEALHTIIANFMESMGRRPTKAEIRAGLEFSLKLYTDDMDQERKKP